MTYFADLGGMLDLLHLTLKIFVAIFAERHLRKTLLSSMYRVQKHIEAKTSQEKKLLGMSSKDEE